MKAYLDLTKTGIIIFALMSALAGYAMSASVGRGFDGTPILVLLMGLYFACAGSFALNQAQEWKKDRLMDRTKKRPIASGMIAPWQGYLIGFSFTAFGLLVLYALNPLTAQLTLATVIMYNGLYTLIFKKYMAFGAVPGAIPGAMPVLIGYSVNSPYLLTPEAAYLFLIMFLWQMPHFWSLAIRFKDDYAKAGFPVLPTQLGASRTLYHIGLYMFVYVGLAVGSPWFLQANVMYLLLVVPVAIKVMLEFFKYFKAHGQQRWLPFFLWTNLSVLVFLSVPVLDRWVFYLWSMQGF